MEGNLLRKESEFYKLNEQLELKAQKLMEEVEYVMNNPDLPKFPSESNASKVRVVKGGTLFGDYDLLKTQSGSQSRDSDRKVAEKARGQGVKTANNTNHDKQCSKTTGTTKHGAQCSKSDHQCSKTIGSTGHETQYSKSTEKSKHDKQCSKTTGTTKHGAECSKSDLGSTGHEKQCSDSDQQCSKTIGSTRHEKQCSKSDQQCSKTLYSTRHDSECSESTDNTKQENPCSKTSEKCAATIKQTADIVAKLASLPDEAKGVGPEAALHILKVKTQLLELELEHVQFEMKNKTETWKKTRQRFNQLEEDHEKWNHQAQNLGEIYRKQQDRLQRINTNLLKTDAEANSVLKEVESVRKDLRQSCQSGASNKAKVNRCLDENAKLRSTLNKMETEEKELRELHSRDKEHSTAKINLLEKRKKDLVRGVGTQLELTGNLRTQLVHIGVLQNIEVIEGRLSKI